MKERINKPYFIKIKNLCCAKDTAKKKKMRRQTTDWMKIFVKDITDKSLLSKIYREPIKLNNKTMNNLSKK